MFGKVPAPFTAMGSTGPWRVVNVVTAGLNLIVRLHGRQVRQRTVAASYIKPFYSRPLDLRLSFEDGGPAVASRTA